MRADASALWQTRRVSGSLTRCQETLRCCRESLEGHHQQVPTWRQLVGGERGLRLDHVEVGTLTRNIERQKAAFGIAARDLLVLFPDVHDGYDRLGMVYEARGDKQKAADCYRNVIAFIKEHPDNYGPGFEDAFVKLVDRLDPPTET